MGKRWQRWVICASIAAGSAIGAALLSNFRFFELLNFKSLDAHFILRGRMPPAPNIVLILADQKTLDQRAFDLRMFWHPFYADAIRAAGHGGAKVIGLDVAFGVPVDKWEPDYDRLLTAAVINSSAPVVCGFVEAFNSNPLAQTVPINLLSASLGLAGFSNLTVDSADDFVRRQELIEAPSRNPADAPPSHSFAMRVVEKYLGTEAEFHDGRLTLAGDSIPIDANSRSILIREANPPSRPDAVSVQSVSLVDVVNAERAGSIAELKRWFDGKIVLIGTDTVDDRYPTPFFTPLSGIKWTTAGVEIQAGTIRTLLDRKYLLDVSGSARSLALIDAALAASVVVYALPAWSATVWIGLELLAIFGIADLLFRSGLILSTSETMIAALGSAGLTIVYRMFTAEQRGNLFHRAFSLFVGKEVARSLDESADIRLSGKRLNLTIMFTDIRGFTAYTEQVCDEKGPEVVVETLNQYMATMVGIIVKHHGRANKFIGDGILGIFSDEDEHAVSGDHALRAVRCALEIVTAPSQFQTGCGVHTGLAVVGNVGSADKMEYTVLGDTVNLASRLESLNKEFHTRLLMSEATRNHLGGAIDTTFLGSSPVRGKAVPINLYTAASLVPAAAPGSEVPASKALTNA